MSGWAWGFTLGAIVVVAVVALVVPILLLAARIGRQAQAIDDSLLKSVSNTSALSLLNTTIEHALTIIGGLKRGRGRLGG
ncbi:MAG: hypothetical protein WAW88_00095 [Nocardioides sp.]